MIRTENTIGRLSNHSELRNEDVRGRIVQFLLFLVPVLASAEVTVGFGGDYSSIAAALETAGEDQVILELLDPIYNESGLIINTDVILIGRGPEKTIIQAAGVPGTADDRVFSVTTEGRAVFRDLTIRHGRPTAVPHRGGGIDNEGYVKLVNCELTENEAVYGGALFTRGWLELTGCSISGNYTTKPPNELLNTGIGCRGSGGAIKTEKGGELKIDSCSIIDNYAYRRGGGIFVACESTVRITNTTIAGNDCRRRGGGIYNKGDLFLNHVTIADNSSLKRGSGLCTMGRVEMEASLITGSSFQDFYTAEGSGIYGGGFLTLNRGNFVSDGSLEGAGSGNPRLGKLKQDGSEPAYMRPGIFSPARLQCKTDSTPDFDQRGHRRGNRPYIGACEGRLIFSFKK